MKENKGTRPWVERGHFGPSSAQQGLLKEGLLVLAQLPVWPNLFQRQIQIRSHLTENIISKMNEQIEATFHLNNFAQKTFLSSSFRSNFCSIFNAF